MPTPQHSKNNLNSQSLREEKKKATILSYNESHNATSPFSSDGATQHFFNEKVHFWTDHEKN